MVRQYIAHKIPVEEFVAHAGDKIRICACGAYAYVIVGRVYKNDSRYGEVSVERMSRANKHYSEFPLKAYNISFHMKPSGECSGGQYKCYCGAPQVVASRLERALYADRDDKDVVVRKCRMCGVMVEGVRECLQCEYEDHLIGDQTIGDEFRECRNCGVMVQGVSECLQCEYKEHLSSR